MKYSYILDRHIMKGKKITREIIKKPLWLHVLVAEKNNKI